MVYRLQSNTYSLVRPLCLLPGDVLTQCDTVRLLWHCSNECVQTLQTSFSITNFFSLLIYCCFGRDQSLRRGYDAHEAQRTVIGPQQDHSLFTLLICLRSVTPTCGCGRQLAPPTSNSSFFSCPISARTRWQISHILVLGAWGVEKLLLNCLQNDDQRFKREAGPDLL